MIRNNKKNSNNSSILCYDAENIQKNIDFFSQTSKNDRAFAIHHNTLML